MHRCHPDENQDQVKSRAWILTFVRIKNAFGIG